MCGHMYMKYVCKHTHKYIRMVLSYTVQIDLISDSVGLKLTLLLRLERAQ